MIRFDCAQGSGEWAALRLGIPTASRFDEIMTPKTMKLSGSAEKYAWELLAEQVLGYPQESVNTDYTIRGTTLERKAIQFYEFTREVETEQVGFVMRDDRRVGCSPDRLVGADGGLEIKVPNAKNHIGYLLDDEGIGYRCQVQGCLWLCEREWWDTLSYNPDMPEALVRVHRDEAFIKALAATVDQFLEMLDGMKVRLARRGLFPDFQQPDLRIA